MHTIPLLLILALGGFVAPAHAQTAISDYTLVRVGEVHELDYATQTAIISGYRYAFTGLPGYKMPKIRMLGSLAGAFQLLTPGMRVRVLYHESQHARLVVEMQQVPGDTLLGVPPIQ